MFALGQKPAARWVGIISVYLSRADMREDDKDVRIVPKGDYQTCARLTFYKSQIECG
jgi:hypothetical protein